MRLSVTFKEQVSKKKTLTCISRDGEESTSICLEERLGGIVNQVTRLNPAECTRFDLEEKERPRSEVFTTLE